MRKFKLLSHDELRSFSLFDNSIIVTDVEGLGTNFNLSKNEGTDRKYISDVDLNFDNITLLLYFGVNGNAYRDYNDLMSFISLNGKNKFILEYTVDDKIRYCDIWLKNAPKTQKDTTSTIKSKFIFERLSPWYTKINIVVSLQMEYREVNFPLDIPIPFSGSMSVNDISINNTFLKNYYPDIVITGPLTHPLTLTLKNVENGKIINKIVVEQLLQEEEWFRINSEDNKITYYNKETSSIINGYNEINHTYDSFIVVPNGKYLLSADLQLNDMCQIVVSYKQFVLD